MKATKNLSYTLLSYDPLSLIRMSGALFSSLQAQNSTFWAATFALALKPGSHSFKGRSNRSEKGGKCCMSGKWKVMMTGFHSRAFRGRSRHGPEKKGRLKSRELLADFIVEHERTQAYILNNYDRVETYNLKWNKAIDKSDTLSKLDIIVAQTPQFHVTLMAPEEWIYKATQSELTGKHTGNRGTWQRHYFGERRDRGFNGTPRLMACLHERVIRFPPIKSHRRKWQNALEDEGLCKATSRENQSSWQSFEGMPCTPLCDVCD